MSQDAVPSLYGGPATRRVRTRDLLLAKQRGERWAMLTSYDQYTAGLFDTAGIPALLAKAPGLHLVREPGWKPGYIIRGLKALKVEV